MHSTIGSRTVLQYYHTVFYVLYLIYSMIVAIRDLRSCVVRVPGTTVLVPGTSTGRMAHERADLDPSTTTQETGNRALDNYKYSEYIALSI